MIASQREYEVTREQIARFERALDRLAEEVDQNADMHPLLRKAQEDSLKSQIQELREQAQVYEARQREAISEEDEVQSLKTLEQLLVSNFTDSQLRALSSAFGLDYETLEGDSKDEKVLSLIQQLRTERAISDMKR